MDWVDLLLKFSSELLVIGLAVAVCGLNIFFFSKGKVPSDGSHAFAFVNMHSGLNAQLYAKQTSISTIVVSQNSLISEAQADDFLGSSGSDGQPADTSTDDSIDSSQPYFQISNPDTVKDLIAKQIKIYQTQPGDTLQSIASANNISIQTIIWANNLPNTTIKPGWQLLILPVNGVLVIPDTNTTLPDIVRKYFGNDYKDSTKLQADMQSIMSYNVMQNEEDIFPGQPIIVPGGTVPPPPPPTTKPTPRSSSGKSTGSGGSAYQGQIDEGGHLFPWGYCTWYLATKVSIPWGGNANQWLYNARVDGVATGSQPVRGAVVVMNISRYGHVAYVEHVGDGGFTVSEMNYSAFGRVDTRWILDSDPLIRGFIYP